MSALLEPFQYAFMNQALVIGALVGAVCAVLSCFLILKGWSLMGDAVSHAVLPGIVLAYAAGVPLAVGAFISGLFCAVATGFIKAHSRVKEDTVMGVVFTGMFALGLVLYTKFPSDMHLDKVLFGSILGVSREQVIENGVLSLITLAVILLLRRDLLLFCFDPNHARSIGLNTTFLYYVMLSLLAMTIVISIEAVGIILVIAMLITPGCVGYLLTDRFDRMLMIAVSSAVFSSLFGVYVSFFIDADTGPCIVLTQSLIFVLTLVFAPKHGLLANRKGARAALAS